jgi:hypothetical protein
MTEKNPNEDIDSKIADFMAVRVFYFYLSSINKSLRILTRLFLERNRTVIIIMKNLNGNNVLMKHHNQSIIGIQKLMNVHGNLLLQ